MSELVGSLSSIAFTRLVRFLADLGKTGDLLVSSNHWLGQVSFDGGQLIAASIEGERGLAALEFMATAACTGDFEFCEGVPTLPRDQQLGAAGLAQFDRVAQVADTSWRDFAPDAQWIPRLVSDIEDGHVEIVLDRRAVRILLEVDGARSVRDIATRYGLLHSVKALARLASLGLIDYSPAEISPGSVNQSATPTPLQPSRGLHSVRAGAARVRDILAVVRGRMYEGRARQTLLEVAQPVALTAALVLGLRGLVQNFRVEGISMQPNFQAGQVLVVNRAAYYHLDGPLANILPSDHRGAYTFPFGGPQRGDIAVFRAPPQPDTDYIKRIIGLPGDAIAIANGRVWVNNTALSEPYIQFPADYTFPSEGQALIVPDGKYFVLGDNRPESLDSHFGWFVAADDLIGRAWLRYWPPSTAGVVQPAGAALPTASAGYARQ